MSYDRYCIIDGYKINPTEVPCDVTDQIVKGFGDACQRDVYISAGAIAATYPDKIKSVLDIGTGSGFKLIKHFSHLDTLGLEKEPNYSFLLKQYPDRQWAYADYSSPPRHFDLVVCADVLEHVMDPDVLMQYIKDAAPWAIVLSTPARELLQEVWPEHRKVPNGPPLNTSHVREWTTEEFVNYADKWFGQNGYKSTHSIYDNVGNMVILIKNND